jgi:hypothetical protein
VDGASADEDLSELAELKPFNASMHVA